MKTDKELLRSVLNSGYQLQALRIQIGSRLVSDFYSHLDELAPNGEDENAPPSEDDPKIQKVLKRIRGEYNSITEGVLHNLPTERSFTKKATDYELVTDYTRLIMIDQYLAVSESEQKVFRRLSKMLDSFPLYTTYLKDVKGCGAAMSAVLISYFDFTKSKYVSSMWRYAGLDVVTTTTIGEDGIPVETVKARGKYAAHLVDVTYTSRDGEEKTKKSLAYNPFLRGKLLGVLASSFLRTGNEKYVKFYADYKNRINTNSKYDSLSKMHKHRMALRYMMQRFLADLYVQGRTLEGLEVSKEYHEVYHGHIHGK